VFGNVGGGKSTLARRLTGLTGLPLYNIDLMQFRTGGEKIPHDEFLQAHAELIRRDAWIIDGFGDEATAWDRFSAADTLIHIDLPLRVHYFWVTKRLIKGFFVTPKGWPDDSPLWSSTLFCYRTIPLCHRDLTPKYRELVAQAAASKRVHHLTSVAQIRTFVRIVKQEHGVHARCGDQP
jgi:hypothetical protein